MTSLVQSGSTTWATGSQGSAKTITLGAAATAGNMVFVRLSYSHDVINSVTGLGATWSQLQSREGSNNNFESAEIWYCTVVTGSTITITPNPSFSIDGGSAFADEYSGLSGSVRASSTVSSHTNTSTRTSAALSAVAGDLAVVVMTHENGAAPTSYSGSPGTWTNTSQTNDHGGGGTAGWTVTGLHIATGSETPQLTATWTTGADGLIVSAVFSTAATSSDSALATTASGTSAGIVGLATGATLAVTAAVAATGTAVGASGNANSPLTVASVAAGSAGVAGAAALSGAVALTAGGTAAPVGVFAAYDLDDNSSQALNIPVDLSGVLEAQVAAASPPTGQSTLLLRVSPAMPTPSFNSNGRPT